MALFLCILLLGAVNSGLALQPAMHDQSELVRREVTSQGYAEKLPNQEHPQSQVGSSKHRDAVINGVAEIASDGTTRIFENDIPTASESKPAAMPIPNPAPKPAPKPTSNAAPSLATIVAPSNEMVAPSNAERSKRKWETSMEAVLKAIQARNQAGQVFGTDSDQYNTADLKYKDLYRIMVKAREDHLKDTDDNHKSGSPTATIVNGTVRDEEIDLPDDQTIIESWSQLTQSAAFRGMLASIICVVMCVSCLFQCDRPASVLRLT